MHRQYVIDHSAIGTIFSVRFYPKGFAIQGTQRRRIWIHRGSSFGCHSSYVITLQSSTRTPVEETFEEVRRMLEIRSGEIHDNIANTT
jgi:hypothetical protein